MDSGKHLVDIELVTDRTAQSNCRDGFLRLSRLTVRNRYSDGTCSRDYPCDVVKRPHSDAVVVCLYHVDHARAVRVVLREGPRVPAYLRKFDRHVIADARPYLTLIETVAGLIEPADAGPDTLQRRAAIEAREEAGCDLPPGDVRILGGESFASPGISDEKLFFTAATLDGPAAGAPSGDGSVMEETARLVTLDLTEAIAMCRDGRVPDMKTEIALLRLCDHLGFIPQLGLFADELPAELRARYKRLGIAP